MANKLMFCTGGSRSGKSAFALNEANRLPGPKLFVATAEVRDAEMAERVKRHQQERGPEWICMEVPMSKACSVHELMDLALLPPPMLVAGEEALAPGQGRSGFSAVLVDCLSTWVSACQESWIGAPRELESGVIEAFRDFLEALRRLEVPIFLVSLEVGMGLVSPDKDTRQFADILGYVNQIAAQAADEMYFCVSGVPLKVK